MSTPQLVATSDIARIAGVTRAAVSNWIRRHDDFPAPAGGTELKSLYNLSEVLAWLRANGKDAAISQFDLIIAPMFHRYRGVMEPPAIAWYILEALTRRKARLEGVSMPELELAGNAPGGRATDADEIRAEFDRDLEAVELTAIPELANGALSLALGNLHRAGGEYGSVGSKIATVLATLAAAREATSVIDPACGILENVLHFDAQSSGQTTVYAADVNQWSVDIARMRAFINDLDADIRRIDVLSEDPFSEVKVDTVLCEPPIRLRVDPSEMKLADPRFVYGRSLRDGDWLWVQDALAHLNDRGTAFVVLAQPPLFSTMRNELEVRKKIINDRCLEAVISLPLRLLTSTSIQLSILVLKRPGEAPDDVVMIDASQAEVAELTADQLLGRAPHPSVETATVSVDDLMSDDASLVPARWMNPVARDIDFVAEVESKAKSLSLEPESQLSAAISDFVNLRSDTKGSSVSTVKELEEQGFLKLVRVATPRSPAERESSEHLVTARILRGGRLEDLPSQNGPDGSLLLTEPGDVIVDTSGKISAQVDVNGGHILSHSARALRVLRPDELNPEFLAFAIQGEWNLRFMAGATLQRARIQDLEVPILSPQDQEVALRVHRELNRESADLQRSLASLEEIGSYVRNALRS